MSEATEDKRLVMCDHHTKDCPKHCVHSKPHKPFLDSYSHGEEYYCNADAGQCGHIASQPYCICS